MSAASTYLVRWRGRSSGPYPWTVILQKLDDHEIGTFHEVQVEGEWVALGVLLETMEGSRTPPGPNPEREVSRQAPPVRKAVRVRAAESLPSPRGSASEPAGPDIRRIGDGSAARAPGHARVTPNTGIAAEDGGAGLRGTEADQPGEPAPWDHGADRTARSRRRRGVFAALGMAGGFLGLHNFYAGRPWRALMQGGLSVVTVALGYGWFPAWAWALIEVAVVKRDGSGMEWR